MQDLDEKSLLLYSICYEYFDVAKILITAGADLDYSHEVSLVLHFVCVFIINEDNYYSNLNVEI